MTAEELAMLRKELADNEKALLTLVQQQQGEIKSAGVVTAETAKKLAEAEKAWTQSTTELTGKLAEAEKRLGEVAELKARLDEFEAKGQRPGGWGSGEDSASELFVKSFEAANLKQAAQGSLKHSISVPSLFGATDRKAAFLSTAATRLVVPQRTEMVGPQPRRLRVRDLQPARTTQSNAIEFVQEIGFAATGASSGTKTHGAAATFAEGASAPEAQLEMQLSTVAVRDIGHWLPASRQILDDAGQMRGYIDDRLIYGVLYREEVQMLYGDGTGTNLTGLMTHANRQTYARSTNPTDNYYDALVRAITLAHVAEYSPTGIVMHPSDWEAIMLAKGTTGEYLFIALTLGGEQRAVQIPVVVTTAINAGDALVGAFGVASSLWDREQASIQITDSHKDYWEKRLLAIGAFERIAQTIYRPDAFVDVSLNS